MDSFIKWAGGKRLLRKYILAEFPQEISCYVEVFGGAAWVLFGKDRHAEVEVYNDINSNLINLFRCVKYHADALQEELQWCMVSREMFEQAREEVNNRNLTDIQRAARFFIIIKCSFGGTLNAFTGKRVSLNSTIKELQNFKERLRKTVIECMDFEKLISLYDKEKTLFYADPPYYGAETVYNCKFDEADHLRLKNALEKIKGKFILTYNDCSFVRELYQGYQIIPVERQSNIAAYSGKKKYQEVIIKNFGREEI